MQTPEITAYLKTYCGWSAGVRAVLAKYNLPYTEKDIIQNPAFRIVRNLVGAMLCEIPKSLPPLKNHSWHASCIPYCRKVVSSRIPLLG